MKRPTLKIKITKITAALGLASLLTAFVTQAANITWGATVTVTNNTVLALAGVVSNEVYSVNSGGSGAQTTANRYAFANYATFGNVSITGGPSHDQMSLPAKLKSLSLIGICDGFKDIYENVFPL